MIREEVLINEVEATTEVEEDNGKNKKQYPKNKTKKARWIINTISLFI